MNRRLKQAQFEEKMRQLRIDYLIKLQDRLRTTQTCWQKLSTRIDEETLESLHREVHTIAGSGGTYGYAPISMVAKELEVALKDVQQQADARKQKRLQDLNSLFATFEQTIQGVIDNNANSAATPSPRVTATVATTSSAVRHTPYDFNAASESDADADEEDGQGEYLMLVEDDVDLANNLAQQLAAFGYQVKIIHNANDIYRALEVNPLPKVMLVDIILPEGDTAGPDTVIDIHRKKPDCQVPVIYLSARDDAKARLSAVRGCGNAYLSKPIDVALLVEWLDLMTHRIPEEPCRVLLVDDDVNLCQHHALLLEQAGLVVQTCSQALEVLELLRNFNPDVVLMDMYMPEYQGQELTMMIRQLENYSSLPVVYLSTENIERIQLEALLQGGDDFLTKPVDPETLIRVVNYRSMRYRQMRSLMTRDSLTRLLNHRHIKDALEYETNRAARDKIPCSLLMIDVDFFKKVNDTYGHGTGDQVLKTISRFLRQRLRSTDILGRYGGEEFACILPNTSSSAAYQVAENLRKDFACIEHRHIETVFHLTFSCGIASYPDYSNPESLSEAADQALYLAKHNGRNQVQLADPEHLKLIN